MDITEVLQNSVMAAWFSAIKFASRNLTQPRKANRSIDKGDEYGHEFRSQVQYKDGKVVRNKVERHVSGEQLEEYCSSAGQKELVT